MNDYTWDEFTEQVYYSSRLEIKSVHTIPKGCLDKVYKPKGFTFPIIDLYEAMLQFKWLCGNRCRG